ncbi:MAG: inorganic phosphate transporter [Thermoleophilia bacterium]|nr:inorganic phosphate transporter [Thermoleophilia bacterium]
MDVTLVLAIALAFAFALTNGFHDASNAIATLVATKAARPAQALALAAVFTMLGPLLVGAAVATTIGGIVAVPAGETAEVVGAGLVAATGWNLLTWWRGLPSSSGHALVGGLTGSALVAGGVGAVNWGGFDGWHPVGVVGTLVALAVSPVLGALAAFGLIRGLTVLLRTGTRRLRTPVNAGQWVGSAALSLSHGANDAQKTIGVVAALLLASGRISSPAAPLWVELAAAGTLTLGTALGGWRIVRTIGRRIYRIRPLDGLSSQTGSAAVILGASFVGAPVSTTHVVASSIVGVGGGRRRWRHVRWPIVREMLIAWVTTLPACAALAAPTLILWRWLA